MGNLAHNCTVEVKNIWVLYSIPPVHRLGSVNPGRFRRLCVHDSLEDFHHRDFPSNSFFEEHNDLWQLSFILWGAWHCFCLMDQTVCDPSALDTFFPTSTWGTSSIFPISADLCDQEVMSWSQIQNLNTHSYHKPDYYCNPFNLHQLGTWHSISQSRSNYF